MFTSTDYDRHDRGSVAVCLYGSMDNFPEYVLEAGPGYRDGWVSSSAPAVYKFIRSHGREFEDPYFEPADMALDALGIADGQGISGVFTGDDTALGTDRAWQRAFTYGEVRNAEWLAQIYLDVDLLATGHNREDGYRRILVGAPLWIRTSAHSAVELYARSGRSDLVEGRKKRAKADITRAPEAPPRPSSERFNAPPAPVRVEASESEEYSRKRSSGAPTISIPYRVYTTLKAGFVKGVADSVIRDALEAESADHRIFHLGDNFGRVFAFVWSHDKDSAMLLLADFLGALREGHALADQVKPPLRLDEILRGLRRALPSGFSDYDEVVTMARRQVREYYGADPNQ
jgi:hypothetical protein